MPTLSVKLPEETKQRTMYEYDEAADMVIVLAVRHQREQDFH